MTPRRARSRVTLPKASIPGLPSYQHRRQARPGNIRAAAGRGPPPGDKAAAKGRGAAGLRAGSRAGLRRGEPGSGSPLHLCLTLY